MQTGTVPNWLEVFARFFRLGLTSFGGPVAHLGYFRREFVERAAWLDDAAFTEIVALCSILPGPQSSQVGIALGALRAGPAGGVLAWLGFTLPSAFLMAALGLFAPSFLLLAAAAPLSTLLRRLARARSILLGLNASVVGLLAAVAIDPIGRSLSHAPVAAALGLIALVALVRLSAPVWLVVLGSALAGAVLRAVLRA